MPSIIIEPGKFYKTRGGKKARIYAVDGDGRYSIHGAVSMSQGWRVKEWNDMGLIDPFVSLNDDDLVAYWTEPPVVDWERFPKHIVAVAMDEDGGWYAFTFVPTIHDEWHEWGIGANRFCIFCLCMSEFPSFSGDWRDSLAIRPGYEEDTP